jgi:chloramphenicol O-acetyltransferase
MSKVLSTIDYWEEFHKKYPNLEHLRAFIAEDPILTKMFNIEAVPNILFSAISDYYFEDKIRVAQYISLEDIEHLNNLYIETGEDP